MMKITVCIQAQDTGRVLFFKEDGKKYWTWLETGEHFDWHHSGAMDRLRSRISTYIDVNDLPVEWFSAKNQLNIIHFKVPEERVVYTAPDFPFSWCSLFEFPEELHPFINNATSDLLFVESIVTGAAS